MKEKSWYDLTGKVALVYGASRGLGREAALQLGRAGACVACAARDLEGLEQTASLIAAEGGETMVGSVDVTEADAVRKFTREVVERLDHIDVLVFSAGVMHAATALRTSNEDWERVLQVNLTGAFLACREAAEHMKRQGGRIILFGTSFVGRVLPITVAYSVSKGGLHQLVRSLAAEWARYNITVNGIAPGYFETEMPKPVLDNPELRQKVLSRIPLNRVGQPSEIGPLVQYLASDASAFMTGSVLRIDGGQSLNVS